MKTKEFVEYMGKNTNRTTRDDQIESMVKKTLEVKSYLSIKQKKELVQQVINECIIYDNGIFKFDNIVKYVYFTMYTFAAYTNLELSDDVEDDFDALSESKLLPIIVCLIQQEYDDVNLLLEMQCDYILADNCIEAKIGQFLNDVLDRVDSAAGKLEKYASKIDMKELLKEKDTLTELLSKFRG